MHERGYGKVFSVKLTSCDHKPMMHGDKAWKDSHRTLKVLPCGRSQECIEKSAAWVIRSGSKRHPRPWCVGWPACILTHGRLCAKPCCSRPPHPSQVGVLCVSPVLQPCGVPTGVVARSLTLASLQDKGGLWFCKGTNFLLTFAFIPLQSHCLWCIRAK